MIPIITVVVLAFLYGVYLERKEEKRKLKGTCAQCKHLISLVGLGKGLRCGNRKQPGKWPMPIPSSKHTCSLFEKRSNEKNNKRRSRTV